MLQTLMSGFNADAGAADCTFRTEAVDTVDDTPAVDAHVAAFTGDAAAAPIPIVAASVNPNRAAFRRAEVFMRFPNPLRGGVQAAPCGPPPASSEIVPNMRGCE
jgi:hypothetical protein